MTDPQQPDHEESSSQAPTPSNGESPPAPPTPPPPAAPPTHRDASLLQQPRSKWPVVIGVILIVLGCLSLLGGCFGLISPWMAEFSASMAPDQEMDFSGWMAFIIISSLVLTLLAVLQIVGGAGLIGRRRWAKRVCTIWAALKLLVVTANVVPSYIMQSEQMNQVQQSGMPGGTESIMLVFVAAMLVLGLLWSWALPVFTLIWFSRSETRAEVATWNQVNTEASS